MVKTRDSITDIWGKRTGYEGEGDWPVRVDENTSDTPDHWVQSACVLCSNGCALDIGVKNGKIVGVRGRSGDRINKGRLGPKGLNGWVANASKDRLTQPLIKRNEKFEAISWDEAMSEIVSRCQNTISNYGSGSIGFYTTGQMFIEEYFTLCTIAKPGIGTLHVDGNTRLCTSTAAQALKETFGSDGQTASYSDVDVTDCFFLAGHNVAYTQTVLWSRMLDRLHGSNPPRLIVIDPRKTPTAKEADIHLAPRVGTNVALMNGILNFMIQNQYIDPSFIKKHTQGFDNLKKVVSKYTPKYVEQITKVPSSLLIEASEILGTTPTLLSTVLQGFYQSNQATAASVQVNNVNLIRGLIAEPGCGILQMNGQPTAQNTRETGCDGEYPGFANFHNPNHIKKLAEGWNVEPIRVPSWHLPSHVMEIMRHCEQGLIKFLWITATNPAVSLPELHRIKQILKSDKLFVIVQDAFMTETAELADLVLPTALWGEKTGTFTNTDRTVHLSEKAIEPPGEAKSDLDILLDFAKRMGFKDKDGEPLVKWSNSEEAFNAWCAFSKGWLCDYSGLSYQKLRGKSGIQWPCNEKYPDGCERLYLDFHFPTKSDRCQTFGHDLETGGAIAPEDYKANDPNGKALLKAAEYLSPIEEPDKNFPFILTTGRVVYQFHTRTKTGRSPLLNNAAPQAFAEISEHDAKKLGVKDGDWVEVYSRRGSIHVPIKIDEIIDGHVFIPFHYGNWDDPEANTAANELTLTAWDPVSKQPYFKTAAVNIRTGKPSMIKGVKEKLEHAADRGKEILDKISGSLHKERKRVNEMIALCINSHQEMAKACEEIAARYFEEKNLQKALMLLSKFSKESTERLEQFAKQYGKANPPKKLRTISKSHQSGPYGLLLDLQELYVLSWESQTSVLMLEKAAKALRDEDMSKECNDILTLSKRQQQYLKNQLEHRAANVIDIKW